MKRSIPKIKIGSAGIGFILCLIVIIGLGFLLNAIGNQTIVTRQDRVPMAEVILNPDAYAQKTSVAVEEESEDLEVTEPLFQENELDDEFESDIEKDLPPVIDDIDETIDVTPVETREPIIEDGPIISDPITFVEPEPMEEIIAPEVVEEVIIPAETEKAVIDRNQAQIVLVLSDMGLSASATETALTKLPNGITLAFAPYANNVDTWVKRAIGKGHDVLISIPMEPKTFPRDDPGPNALLTSVTDAENIKRLDWALSQTNGYIGIVNFMGSRFTANQEKLSPVIKHLKDKNIMILDSGSSGDSLIPSMSRVNNIAYVRNDRFIDNKATATAIDEQLAALENIALSRGQAIGIGFPYPVTLERLQSWTKTLDGKGITLTPISELNTAKAE